MKATSLYVTIPVCLGLILLAGFRIPQMWNSASPPSGQEVALRETEAGQRRSYPEDGFSVVWPPGFEIDPQPIHGARVGRLGKVSLCIFLENGPGPNYDDEFAYLLQKRGFGPMGPIGHPRPGKPWAPHTQMRSHWLGNMSAPMYYSRGPQQYYRVLFARFGQGTLGIVLAYPPTAEREVLNHYDAWLRGLKPESPR